MTRRVAVLGGGALGLTVALRLAQRGEDVVVFERERLPGGLAAGFEIEPEMWLEKFYHHLFRSDTRAIALIDELGFSDRLEWQRPVTATLRDGAFRQLDSPGSLLRFSPLPFADRLRMGAAVAVLKAMPNPRLLEGGTAATWIKRWMGRHAYDMVWGPLLEGKFGAAADEIAMPWFWARVHDRTPQLGYLRGGFQQLYARLAERIGELGGETRLGTAVQSVAGEGDGLRVTTDAGAEGFDRVVSTLPTRLTCRLTADLPAAYRDRYEWGRAYGAHCLIVALDRPLTSAYWTNINDPGYPFMALVEHTNYVPASDYGGRHLIYLGNYRPMDDPLMTASKDDVLRAFVPHLARINSAFDPSWVIGSWMHAAPFAQPIVTVGYRDHIPPFTTPIRHLFLANMFQVYPHDRGQNYSIALAERLVELLGRNDPVSS